MLRSEHTAIELFCGIGGFRLGLEKINIPTIWANDIDPSSCRVYRSNFGGGELCEGDIRAIDAASIPDHDILTAGFPCQPFSSAGKKLGVRDATNGTLFSEIVRIVRRKRPRLFILENVKRILAMEGGHHFRTVLQELSSEDYIVEWRLIDAVKFGLAQSRERVFLVGSRIDHPLHSSETLGSIACLVTSSDKEIARYKSLPMRLLLKPIDRVKTKLCGWGLALNGSLFTAQPASVGDGSPGLRLRDILQAPNEVPEGFDYTTETRERIKSSVFVNRYYNGVELLWNQSGGARFGYTIFGVNGNSSTLTASTSRHYERYKVGDRYRRLTNIEYARLMGFPDDWCREASIYDQYALFGNSVVPACVEWIAKLATARTRGTDLRLAVNFR